MLGLLIPAILVFRALFLPGPAVWGDAPYFYPEKLGDFLSEPDSWVSWGNNFGGINQTLWLTPLMLFYGILYKFFGLTNDVLIRIIFYFPAVFLSIVTPIIFTRSLGFGKLVQFFASLFYVFNTYFLLLIDGGQVGVALAFSLFPLGLTYLRSFLIQPVYSKFFLSLLVLAVLTSFDPRVGVISVVSILVWILLESFLEKKERNLKNLKWLIPLVLATAAVNSYWIIPLLNLSEGVDITVSNLGLVSLLNGLFFFGPHWPTNEFGKVVPPPFYFLGLPLLIFGSIFLKKNRKVLALVFCLLFFVFLVKGATPPLGEMYNWVIVNLRFGAGFRDSTKFFAPLFLFGGILIGVTVGYLSSKLPKFSWFLIGLVYVYLLFLIHPALLGSLNGVLAQKTLSDDFRIVHKKLTEESELLRAAWFPERHPFGFHTEEKSAIDAKGLINERPFAALNVGNDPFNFMHRQEFVDWFNLLGVKHLIFSGDPRKITWNDDERENWSNLLQLTATTSGLLKENWNTSFPVYSLEDIKPRMFATDKVIAIVGSDDIYKKIRENREDFSVGNQAFVFFEDGKFEPRNLQAVASQSAILVFNGKSEEDLTMSFLQKYFINPLDADFSQWAVGVPSEYLIWKYQLLIRGVDVQEFDYGEGIAFSTQEGERISFSLRAPENGEYVFASRLLSASGKFKWNFEEGINLKEGQFKREFVNNEGISVLNTVALIPKKDWEAAKVLTKQFVGHFRVVKIDDEAGILELSSLLGGNWYPVNFQKLSNERYEVIPPENANWIVFTDSYNSFWKLKRGMEYLPSSAFYSMVNGFYFDRRGETSSAYFEPTWTDTEIVFRDQDQTRWGFYWSIIAVLFLAVIFLMKYSRKE